MKWIGTWEASYLLGDGSGLTNLPPGTESDPIWTAASAAINTHIASTAIHYASNAIHASLALLAPHIADTTNPHSVSLSEVENPEGDKTYSMANKLLKWTYQAPTPAGDYAGAFEIEATGGFTGNLVHIHQHTGNVGTTYLVDIEGTDTDVVPFRIRNGVPTTVFQVDLSGNVTLSGTVDGIDIATDVAANTTHAASSALHFTEASIDHTAITNIGTNAHTAIDTHIASTALHFSSAAMTSHMADSSDPHGASITQTSMAITGDNDASGAAIVRNILIGTEASPGSASLWTQGTVYLQYTA